MMRAKREFLVTLSALALLNGCGEAPPNRDEVNKGTLALVVKTLDNPFFTAIQSGFESKASGRDVIVRGGSKETDLDGQLTILRSLTPNTSKQRGVGGVALTPVSSGIELISDIKRYQDAGVPIILIDTIISQVTMESKGTYYNVALQSDNAKGGELAADLIASKLVKKEGDYTILMLEGAVASDTARQRRAGFDARIQIIKQERKLTLTIVYRVANWRREEAFTVTSSLLGTISIDAIFAANDEMALGAVRAYELAGKSIPPIVGFDAIPEAMTAIRSGKLVGTIAQDPRAMGERAATLLTDASTANLKFKFEAMPVLVCAPDCK